jgi:hypothetical protein
MGRQAAARLMDRAGFLFLVLGLLALVWGDKRLPTGDPFGTGADEAFAFIAKWACSALGALLFLGRPLLWLRWWYAWIAFFAVGVVLLILFFDSTSAKPVLLEMGSEASTIMELVGFAGIVMGFVFLSFQRLVRQTEGPNPPRA